MTTALREVFARFGVAFDSSALVSGNAAVDGMIGQLRELGQVVAGAALVQGVITFVDGVRSAAVEIDHAGAALGLNARALQEWRAVLARAGVSAEQATPAIQALRRNASAAALAGGQMGRDFRTLGVDIRDGHGGLRTTEELLGGVLEGLADVQDPTTRAAIAMRLMGESGARMGPLLENGAEGVRAVRAEIAALGGGLSEDAIEASVELTNASQGLDMAMLGLRGRIALFVLPAITRVTEVASRLTAGFSRLASRTHLIEVGMVALGVAGVVAAAPMIAAWTAAALPFVALAAAVLFAILVFDDLWSAVDGGDSVLADGIDAIEEYAASGTDALAAVAMAFEIVIDALTSVVQLTAQAGAGLAGLAGFAAEALGFDEAAAGAFGVANDLGTFGERDLATEGDGSADSAAITARVLERRAGDANRGMLTPDALERVLATRDVRVNGIAPAGTAGGGTTVSIGRIDASGLDEVAATRVVERAVTNALAREADSTLDALAGGV